MANPTLPSNVPRPQQVSSSIPPSSSPPVPSNGLHGVRVKTEPGYEAQSYPATGIPPNYASNIAQQRAAQNLQQKFGAGASQQINQLQAQAAMGVPGTPPQRNPVNIQLPPQLTDQQRQEQAEYKRRQQAQQYQSLQQAQQRPTGTNPQTDGADDWDSYVAHCRWEASKTSGQADATIREQVEQTNRALEGGGLMLPLAEHPRSHQSKKPKVSARRGLTKPAVGAAETSKSSSAPSVLHLDGAGDEDDDEDDKTGIKDELFGDDDDEDAINSDLDDPDDALPEEEQEEGRPNQIMLCTYDKVARVKNKWKCTLKDGVLNTGGKEYIFTLSYSSK